MIEKVNCSLPNPMESSVGFIDGLPVGELDETLTGVIDGK